MTKDTITINGIDYELGAKAENVSYDNTDSGMTADNVQDALDELAARPQGGGSGGEGGTFAPYAGKKFAVIGDSFTAGSGSWFGQMCTILGATMLSNEADSGGAWHGQDSISAYQQAQDLVSHVGNNHPDYILVVMGVNDIGNDSSFNPWASYRDAGGTLHGNTGSVSLGDIVYTSGHNYSAQDGTNNEIDSFDLTGDPLAEPAEYFSFTAGVQATLTYLKRKFPNAIIKIGWTPSGIQYISGPLERWKSTSWGVLKSYIERMQDMAYMYGVEYIDTTKCGICYWLTEDYNAYTKCGAHESAYNPETGKYANDNHPSIAGHARIAQYMARLMMGNL